MVHKCFSLIVAKEKSKSCPVAFYVIFSNYKLLFYSSLTLLSTQKKKDVGKTSHYPEFSLLWKIRREKGRLKELRNRIFAAGTKIDFNDFHVFIT